MTKTHRLPDGAGFRHFAGEPLTVYCLGKLNGFSHSAAALVLGERVAMGDCFMAISGIALAAFAAAQAAAPQAPLNLTCGGAGVANKATAHTAYSTGYSSGMIGTTPVSGSGSETTTIYGTRLQGFEDQVDIRLFSGDDRIRMPRTMLPMFHGGSDGWFKLKNVRVDSRAIHASVAVNFMNNPKVYIDRVTGTISISGKSGDYSGECQVIDASAPPKF